MLLKDELKSIISGTGQVTKGTAIQTVANYIRKSKVTGTVAEDKKQETASILSYTQSDFFNGSIVSPAMRDL